MSSQEDMEKRVFTPSAAIGRAEEGLPPEKLYFLHRTQVLTEVQAELIQWAKGRFWVIAVVFATVGFFGVKTMVRELFDTELRSAMKAASAAESGAAAANTAVAEAKKDTDSYRRTVESLRDSATRLEAEQEASSANVRAEARLSIDGLQGQVARLEKTLAELLEASSADKSSRFQSAVDQSRARSDQEKDAFEANSKYSVDLLRSGQSKPADRTLIDVLRKAGFKTAEFDMSPEKHAEVWAVPQVTLKNATGFMILYGKAEKEKAEQLADLVKKTLVVDRPALVEKGKGEGEYIGIYFPPG